MSQSSDETIGGVSYIFLEAKTHDGEVADVVGTKRCVRQERDRQTKK